MSRLVRMDRTGHTTLAEWTPTIPRPSRPPSGLPRGARPRLLRDGLHRPGPRRAGHELPVDAELVILRLPISGG